MKFLRKKTYNLLRKSEKYAKTDMVYLAKNSFWINSSQAISILTAFTLSVVLANLLPPETFGTYKYILSIAGILSIFSLSGLPVALTRAVARGFEGSFMESFWISMRWGIIVAIIGGVGALYYFLNGNNVLGFGLLIIGCFTPIIDSNELASSFLSGKKNFRVVSIMASIRVVTVAIGLIITVIITKNPLFLVLSYFILHTAITSIIFFYVRARWKPNSEVDPGTFNLGKHTSIMNSFNALSVTIDSILVFHFFGPIQLAIYNFAQAIPDNLAGFIKGLNTIAVPKLAMQDKEIVKKTMFSKSLRLFLLGLIMAVIYVLLAPTFFSIFFPKYIASVPYSQVYSIILIFSSAIPVAFLDSQVAIKEKYISSLIANTFRIITIFLGVYFWGLWGLIIARVITKMFSVSLTFFIARRI